MKSLKDRVLEIVEIVKQCPENLQPLCFELLLKNELDEPKPPAKQIPAKVEPKEDTGDAGEDTVKTGAQDNIVDADLHTKTKRFIEKFGVSLDVINNVFYKEGSEILPLYEDLKTTKMAEAQIRVALLQSLRNGFGDGDFRTNVEDVRTEVIARKAYDKGNFIRNFNNNASFFDFEKVEKGETIRVSEDGKKKLAAVLAELS